MKRRWFFYLIIGIVFGIIDFYYQTIISNFFMNYFSTSPVGVIISLVLILGIWLVPIVPIVLYEIKISPSRLRSSLVSILIWCTAIISYYFTNAIQLAFSPTRPELHFANRHLPYFWANWGNVLRGDILGGIVEWSGVAVVGGFIIGFLTSSVGLHLGVNRNCKRLND